ncbi:MAG TPA: tRNA (adenosine(37)-N6)-threonylcarbamoyltransferase complex dimerization subunit type 1 TsaB [Acidocella sp.]|uniref:tRNA (adenosine(37)-N6)-threonylcarbamoyltransferase complex dimerization subunit type 1 TsaB n=1 Tax=Acidocella sp. TaxID=50710 RepID=UPI002C630A75|nr:tRNA (adenosine(37)-N6)-threonylcarbamoyltransferase complex dimerization subunit type 1 TsaB [Acidocella sp.]HVE22883.1 tRNA (adenosine(37)-N6)-threonylcarbamoyltransferase complex dimerization subunit type 1 TsaB [Acidocella sp.]
MSILAIDAAGPRAGIALLGDDGVVAWKAFTPGRPGLIETLPLLLREAAAQKPASVAVTIGPGSFTGLRTAISLAQGFAAAAGIPLLGVTVAEAYRASLPDLDCPLWVALRARRDRIFLLRDDQAEAFADADLPLPDRKVALAGDAADEAASRLAAGGADVIVLPETQYLDPAWVGRAALARQAAGLPPHEAVPLYIDPPEAKLPAAGLRPPPQ